MQKFLKFIGQSLIKWASYLLIVFCFGFVAKITSEVFMIGWNLL